MRSNATNKKRKPFHVSYKLSPRLSGKLWLEKSVNLVIRPTAQHWKHSIAIDCCLHTIHVSFLSLIFIDWVDRDETYKKIIGFEERS